MDLPVFRSRAEIVVFVALFPTRLSTKRRLPSQSIYGDFFIPDFDSGIGVEYFEERRLKNTANRYDSSPNITKTENYGWWIHQPWELIPAVHFYDHNNEKQPLLFTFSQKRTVWSVPQRDAQHGQNQWPSAPDMNLPKIPEEQLQTLNNALTTKFETMVNIKENKDKGGSIVLKYASRADLERLLKQLQE